MIGMENKWWKAFLYLLPAILFLGVFMVYPLVDVFVYSFEEGYNSASQTFFGIGGYNYAYVLHDPYFLQAVENTFLLVVITVPLSTGLALLISLGLSSIRKLQQLFQTIIGAVSFEENYLILLTHERYDVPFKAKDGARLEDGSEVFSYFVCAICPVKPGKELLSYIAEEKTFHNRSAGWAAGMPEMGFLFPAFDGRRTNLYNCLFYTHSSGADNQPLIDALFHVQPPMPADEQRDTFGGVLRNALDEECSLAVVQQVRQELKDRIDAWQETKSDDPLVVSGDELKDVLESCGVSEDKRMQFGAQFDESFGGGAVLNPRNLIDVKKCVLKTPDVSITVNPERPDLVETRTIGGIRYLLIKADEGVELNGIDLAEDA